MRFEPVLFNRRILVWWSAFNKLRKGYFGMTGAFQLLRIGGHIQFDYIFIDFLFWTIRIERKWQNSTKHSDSIFL